jgi:hypothetical protein
MVVTVEIGLHIFTSLTTSSQNLLSLSAYKDKEWAKTLFAELHEKPSEYEQYVGWHSKEYHGKYVNIDSCGVRKTWNPEHFHGKTPNTIYMFGGSNLWGYGARDDHTVPSYVSKMLNNSSYNFFVSNYGENAYSFTQGIIRLILLLKDGHKPNYVIFYDGGPDILAACQTGIPGATWNITQTREKLKISKSAQHIIIGVKGILDKHFMIYRAVKKAVFIFGQKQDSPPVLRYTEKELTSLSGGICDYYIESMALLDHIAQAYDFKYICFWQPSAFTEERLTDEEASIDPRLNNEKVGKIFRDVNQRMMVESQPHFFNISNALSDRTKSCYIDCCHLSEEGDELVATKIVEIFKKEFLSNE